MLSIRKKIGLFSFLLIFAVSCANVVAPSGGPKDVTPPVLVKAKPPVRSTHFTGNKIKLTFNEFIQLNDAPNQVMVSPPPEKIPEFRTAGKSLIITFSEKLKENTTYSINFGDCIRDFTENNPLTSFCFAFSTGNHTDSLSVEGVLADAFTLDGKKDILVMLYKRHYDSVPYKERPDYLTKTLSDGSFSLKNLAPGNYLLFALGDANNNLLYDQITEPVAFADSLVTPQYIPEPDATKKTRQSDSIPADTATVTAIKKIRLLLFTETDTMQRLLKEKVPQIGQFQLIFKWPVKNPELILLKKTLPDNWYLTEFNPTRDTLTCWLKNLNTDSVYVQVKDRGIILDTLALALKTLKDTAETFKARSGKGSTQKGSVFKLQIIPSAGPMKNLELNRPLMLEFSHPVAHADLSKIRLSKKVDTTEKEIKARYFFADSGICRKLVAEFSPESKTSYELFIPPAVFTDIYGLKNDTLKLKFTTADMDNYRILTFNVRIEEQAPQYIFQLLDNNRKIIREKIITGSGPLTFDFLYAGNYSARIIADRNSNGRWDSGNYLQKIQPEKVFYLPSPVTLHQNWDSEIDWEIRNP